jgi:hypothetical protein
VQGNFLAMPFADESFNAAYAIEATCHANKARRRRARDSRHGRTAYKAAAQPCGPLASPPAPPRMGARHRAGFFVTLALGPLTLTLDEPGPRAQLEEVYGEIFRVLKPGGMFATYEWVATKAFDPADPEHVRIIDEINYGNGLPARPCLPCRA